MGNIFAGSEIVEIGIQIEKNGFDFYLTLAKQSNEQKVKSVFLFLAGEEEKHIKVFRGILDKTAKYEPQGLDAADYFAYMNALAGDQIFTKKGKGELIAKSVKSDKDAVEAAIRFEEESIVFYAGMREVVPDYDDKVIEALILQEEGHLKQLLDMKKLLG